MSDPADVLRRYHAAINALDYAAIADFFAEDAAYDSKGVGALRGKTAIMAAFRGYFAEYPDQIAHDERVETLAENSARSSWSLVATSATTGEKLVRKGEETIHLDAEGKILRVEIEDG